MANKQPGQTRNAILAAGYTLLLVGFLLGVALPYIHTTRAARAEIARFRSEIDTRQSQSRQLKQVADSIIEIKAETHDYARLVPPNQDLGSFLQELYKQLDDSGMSDISVHNLPPTPLGRSEKLPIEVKGKGTYAQFHEFLTRLEKLPRLASVGKLQVDADTEMNGHVEVQLTLFIYNAKQSP
jgi:Tfp pilus assembly protein PilO